MGGCRGDWFFVFCLGVLVVFLFIVGVVVVSGFNDYRLVNIGVSPYYGGAEAAFVFRVDDFVVDSSFWNSLPDNVIAPREWFANYEDALVSRVLSDYPWLRFTVGVITFCSGNCSDVWGFYDKLVNMYGWEIASHSRFHVRPPRESADYLGSLEDIEKHIPNYHVLTYIAPFGKYGDKEAELLWKHGVRIIATTLPFPPIKIHVKDDLFKTGFTVKASDHFPWHLWFKTYLRIALASNRVLILYTHATSYDWKNKKDLLDMVDYVGKTLLNAPGRVWITTLGELYSYEKTARATKVQTSITKSEIDIWVKNTQSINAWRIPVTIVIDGIRQKDVRSITFNNSTLEPLNTTVLSRPLQGYFFMGEKLFVNIIPPGNLTIYLINNNEELLYFPWIYTAWITVNKLRLLTYIIWLPIIIVIIIAYRRRREFAEVKKQFETKDEKENNTYIALVPARNTSHTIVESLKSLLNQTLKPREIIVLDDASTDDTLEKTMRFIQQQNGILINKKIMKNENKVLWIYKLPNNIILKILRTNNHIGKSGMLNNVLKNHIDNDLNYKYVFVLDSDTIIEEDYVEKILAQMKAPNGYNAANGLIRLWKPDKNGILANFIAGAFRELGTLIQSLVIRTMETVAGTLSGLNGAALLIEKKLLDDIGGFPTSTTAEDAELTWKSHLHGYKTGIVPTTAAYTLDPGSLTGLAKKFFRVSTGSLTSLLRLLPKFIEKKKILPLLSITYNIFGGVPLSFSLIHIFLVVFTGLLGLPLGGIEVKLALLFPYTSLAALLTSILNNPLGYLCLVYIITIVEIILLLLGVTIAYKDNPVVEKNIYKSIIYTPVFPVILWLGAIITLIAIPYSIIILVTGKNVSKW